MKSSNQRVRGRSSIKDAVALLSFLHHLQRSTHKKLSQTKDLSFKDETWKSAKFFSKIWP